MFCMGAFFDHYFNTQVRLVPCKFVLLSLGFQYSTNVNLRSEELMLLLTPPLLHVRCNPTDPANIYVTYRSAGYE